MFDMKKAAQDSKTQLPPHVRLQHIRQQRHQHGHDASSVVLQRRTAALIGQDVPVQTQHELHQPHVAQGLQQRLQLVSGYGRQYA